MKINARLAIPVLLASAAAISWGATSEESKPAFPLREKYADLTPISTEALEALGTNVIVVDARNRAEFDVIHVTGAENLLVGKMKKPQLLALRAADDETPLVFYCNGTTCSKSYKAATKAEAWGFENVFVYDAGIFSWAQAHPTQTEFFGDPMTTESVATDIIPKPELQAVSLAPEAFLQRAGEEGWKLYDIRDRKERTEFPITVKGVVKISMDEFTTLLDKPGVIPAERILVIDNVGKQVRWLHYYLRRSERSEYFFLSGGVGAWREQGFDGKGRRID